ncbi:CRISPR-associated endonuclease Cas3'' [Streptomyces sp. CMB-StM0423]|uniref:CRISPR-associated endonuclease Cas3'' n=1 Tax=Streptomyces sp. CMB-StM0423 TaxID=2059884 RepID=UPI000C6FF650|nr:CRISPR-associated endonuclease Cas3'' [Streptomyces sp. CMB-StM0423]AUH40049.1 CRISPR-associated endonuclease Cas3'' [Streptomyces sp. CMB-StM0423]
MTPGHEADHAAFCGLSAGARVAWGKSDRKTDDWLPLFRHMCDSGAVAGRLWDAWLPPSVRELVSEGLPGGPQDGRRLAVWMAASHDIGKATPAFACQSDSLAQTMRSRGLDMPSLKQLGDDRKLAPHGIAGQLLLQEWLLERHGWSHRASGQFAVVVGGHHGVPPSHQRIHDLELRPHLLRTGGPAGRSWKAVQYELLDACARFAGADARLGDWRRVKLTQPAQVALTALVIVADWIASSAELFPYSLDEEGLGSTQERMEAAWRGLDLPTPWEPDEPREAVDVLFRSRFELRRGAVVRPVQEEAVRTAREMVPAGLVIIEAPMGEGKTEAAFAAAEILAARSGAGGCMVALPTRATGDAMFTRLLAWLDHLPRDDGASSVFLGHAKAAFNDTWAGLLRSGSRAVTAVDDDGMQRIPPPGAERRENPAGLQAHQWLRGRKKGLDRSPGTLSVQFIGAFGARSTSVN